MDGRSNEQGLFQGEIPLCYEGIELVLRIHDAGWLGEQHNTLTPQPYALFHAAKLGKDTIYDNGAGALDHNGSVEYWKEWNENNRHTEAEALIHKEVRARKRGNLVLWLIEGIVTIGSIIGFAFVVPQLAIPAGIVVWLALHFFISPRASGRSS